MAQYFRNGHYIGRLLQGFRCKGVPGSMQVNAFEVEIGQNLLKTFFQDFGFKRMAFFRAENQVMGIEVRFHIRKFRTNRTNDKEGSLGSRRKIDRADCLFRFNRP